MAIIETKHRQSEKHPTRYYSTKQERALAEKIDGSRTKNSGATMFDKGDVKSDNILFECKTKVTPSESMSIKKEWLEKNSKEALFMGKDYSVLAFNFGPNEKNYYILDEYAFEEFMRYLSAKKII